VQHGGQQRVNSGAMAM